MNMKTSIVDIHPHIISDDNDRYPASPLFGVQSGWSKERPVTIDELIAAMDEAGVDKAAIVQVSTYYGYDNNYLADSVARFPNRVTAVGNVDLVLPDAPQQIQKWLDRGISGLRLFLGGSTRAYDTTGLDDPRAYPAWEYCGDAGVPIVLNIDTSGFDQVAGLARRFPKTKIVIDHLGHTDLTDGFPFRNAACLFALGAYENVYFKLTPTVFKYATDGNATPETFFPWMVDVFGSHRLAWGSDYPATRGRLSEILDTAREGLQSLATRDQEWVLGRTAMSLYPRLAD